MKDVNLYTERHGGLPVLTNHLMDVVSATKLEGGFIGRKSVVNSVTLFLALKPFFFEINSFF